LQKPLLAEKSGKAYSPAALLILLVLKIECMILGIAHSVNGVPIRLTDERWEHILDSHPELASLRETLLDAVENPDYILASRRGALGAVVVLGRKTFLHVFYVEKSRHDGFILSAYLEEKMNKTKILWRKENQEE